MTVALAERATLASLVARLGGELSGARGLRVVERLATPWEDDLSAGDLVPLTRARAASRLASTDAVLLVTPELAARVPGRALWCHPAPASVVAALLGEVARVPPVDERSRALVEAGAVVPTSVRVGAFAVIRAGAVLGEGCRVGAHAVVHGGVVLGARVVVGDGAVLGAPGFGWELGAAGAVRVPQLGGVRVGDDVEIGAHATVDAGTIGPTVLGAGAKLDAHVHVGHNARIGPGSIVAAQAGFAGSSRVGAGVLVGGQVGVADHVEIGDGARLAAKAGVIGDVPAGATYAGYPAVPRATWLRFHAAGRRRR
ncbi:MAG: UDP-3-O-(3-hydroxymyristoyl)glucosamine N-acyltransferase [Polyangiaceae bacterium]|nr:UDP-3-O-(3-hydroxymyristoyl)glucosamine N-acyltransferase [Polyangiaceae bacterium]